VGTVININMTSLRSIYNLDPNNPMSRDNLGLGMANSTPSTINLPNGGGSYEYPGIFNGQTDPTITPPPAVEQPAPIFNQPTAEQPAEQPTRSKYMNPATGKYYTPQEYANSVAMKIPASKGTGDVSQYAGDALANPNQSSGDLRNKAREMNNTRNDIATGTTDPYSVGKDSGIAYSPQELKAIESAYAGVYDPAINDVFERLKEKQTSDKEEQNRKDAIQKRDDDREDKIFATNENIRQWRATTGTNKTGGGEDKNVGNFFSDTQIGKGANKAFMSIDDFKELDYNLANYFINPIQIWDEEDETYSLVSENFEELKYEVTNGILTNAEAAKEIMDGILDPAVKVYLVNQLPATEEEKEGWIRWIWNRLPLVD